MLSSPPNRATDDHEALLARVRQGELLAELGRLVVQGDGLPELMLGACRIVAEGFGVTHSKIARALPGNEGLVLVTGVGWRPGWEGSILPGDSSPGYAVRVGRSVVTEDSDLDARFAPAPIIAAHGIRSMVNAVVRRRSGIYGVIEADAKEPRSFTAHDIAFIEACAGLVGAALDIGGARDELRAAAARSELLLHELQHRIKNDFAIVNGLVHLESRAGSPEVKAALARVHGRMEALSLVHDQLHTSGRVGRVDLGGYLKALCAAQSGALAADGGARLTFMGEAIETTHDAAIPVGLIVNELVTNAVKHAFPAGQGPERGTIAVELRRAGPNSAEVCVSDDGVGMDRDAPGSTGMKLIPMLVRQLGGELTHPEGPGTRARLNFPLPAEDAPGGT